MRRKVKKNIWDWKGEKYDTKSFKFELQGLDYDVEKKEGIFIGYLTIPNKDKKIFNKKLFDPKQRVELTGAIPLLNNHNWHEALGRIHLGFTLPQWKEKPVWKFKAMGILMPECPNAKALYARLKKEGKSIITSLSLGYELRRKKGEENLKSARRLIRLYEVSIKEEE